MKKKRKIKSVNGKKFYSSAEERKNLKDLVEYEILETLGTDEKEHKILDKICKLEKQLYETITVKEKDLVDEILELWGEALCNERQRFYDAVWDMFRNWNK